MTDSNELETILKELKSTVDLQQKQIQNQSEQIVKLTNLLETQQNLVTYSRELEKQQVSDQNKVVITVMREFQEMKHMIAASNIKKAKNIYDALPFLLISILLK
ncbi:hypothetical protein V7024_12580 [Bacillus sp. JJ864]|uniref:hypothetical protein n=1 Tax=Bacillus sp. JJ864 TaxID=3122975 RepID=UPI003000CF43